MNSSNLDPILEAWSSSLAERLIEIRFVDMREMKAAMKVHLKAALTDCLKIQISDTRRKLDDAKNRYLNFGGGKNNHVQAEIINLKQKLHEENKVMNELENKFYIKEINAFIRKRQPELLEEFFKYFNPLRDDNFKDK